MNASINKGKEEFNKFFEIGLACRTNSDIWKCSTHMDIIGSERDFLPYWKKIFTAPWCHTAIVLGRIHGSNIYAVTECPVCGVQQGCMIYKNVSVCDDCYYSMSLADFLVQEFGKTEKAALRQATRGFKPEDSWSWVLKK